jgi:hypothetical protein
MSILNIIKQSLSLFKEAYMDLELNTTTENLGILPIDTENSPLPTPEHPFVITKHAFSPEEKELWGKNIQIHTAKDYENFGHLEKLEAEVTEFFNSLNNAPDISKEAAESINKLVNRVLSVFGAETGWIAVRASKPTTEVNQPRWHKDGYYYPPEGLQYKFAITLEGNGTLFCDLTEEQHTRFNEIYADTSLNQNEIRSKLAEFIEPLPIIAAKPFDGAIFIVGDPNTAAVHSEPTKIETDRRIFVSIVPGSKENITYLYNMWHNS